VRNRLSRPALAFLTAVAVFIVTGLTTVAGVTQFESFDTNCASCHTEPESSYVRRAHGGGASLDLASAHALIGRGGAQGGGQGEPVRCIDCHSGKGVSGRLGAMALGAHDGWRWLTGTARQPSITTAPLSDEHCLKCHVDATVIQAFDRHFHRYMPDWQALDPAAGSCVTCHTAHTTDGNAAIGFLQQQRTRAVCDQCHSAMKVASP
jgi:predicted CXXCH cytochrome family protein